MQCPKCHSEMEVASFDEVKVDRCRACHGIWFQTGELDRLREETWMSDYVIDEGDSDLGKKYTRIVVVDCPECGTLMRQDFDRDQPHIMYEKCPNGHGTFLDAGEFTDLLRNNFWDKFKPAD